MEITTEDRNNAMGVLRQDYFNDVSNAADTIAEAIDQGEITDNDDLQRYVEETVDGHSRVMYTADAILTLLFSNEDGAYFDEFGPLEDNDWSKLAYAAFRCDVINTLSSRHSIDVGTWDGPEDERVPCALCQDLYEDDELQYDDGEYVCESCYNERHEPQDTDYELKQVGDAFELWDLDSRTLLFESEKLSEVKRFYDAGDYFPTVWRFSDHGNPEPVTDWSD